MLRNEQFFCKNRKNGYLNMAVSIIGRSHACSLCFDWLCVGARGFGRTVFRRLCFPLQDRLLRRFHITSLF
jgi:hypothetical protein